MPVHKNFQAANPLTSRVIDAFAKIEVQDRQVNKIVMPLKAFEMLKREHDLCCPVPNNELIAYARTLTKGGLDGTTSGFDTQASLYGASILIADHFKVVSDGIGYYPLQEPVPYSSFMGNFEILVKSRAEPLYARSPGEDRALETLREMISETDFRKYLKHAFILVTGTSGLVYQIFRTRNHIKVWCQGVVVEELCVRIADPKVPPTDNVIAFKTMIECSEEDIRKMANVYKMIA